MLEILSHVNKRVRGHASIKMPLDPLLALYAEPSSAPLVRNFALVYLEMAYERATEEAKLAVVRSERLASALPCETAWCCCTVWLHSAQAQRSSVSHAEEQPSRPNTLSAERGS